MKKLIAILLIITLNSCSTEEVNREDQTTPTGLNIVDEHVWGNYSVPRDTIRYVQSNDIRVKVEQHKITIYNENGSIREEIKEGDYREQIVPIPSFKLFHTQEDRENDNWFFHSSIREEITYADVFTIKYKKDGELVYIKDLVKNTN